jgi:hypothetical protein
MSVGENRRPGLRVMTHMTAPEARNNHVGRKDYDKLGWL